MQNENARMLKFICHVNLTKKSIIVKLSISAVCLMIFHTALLEFYSWNCQPQAFQEKSNDMVKNVIDGWMNKVPKYNYRLGFIFIRNPLSKKQV